MSKLIDAARKYVGTPFRHRGRSTASLDCAGLGVKAYADCGVVLPDLRHYGREPYQGGMERALTTALGEPVGHGPDADLEEGDVVVMHFNSEPHHVGLIGRTPYGALSLIHADSLVGKVVEHRLDKAWRDRIVFVHRRPV
ncbi:MAG: C40 family peptidase [Hydrogenophaga sp.]|nr:C40 family peptidase [Hydrogenophaga sp.]